MSKKKPTSKALVPAKPKAEDGYDQLLQQIGTTVASGRAQAAQAVYAANLETYWRVGWHIVEFEQGGKAKAEYGKGLINRLAKDLTLRHGKGFSRSNVKMMRQFYLVYPKSQTLSGLSSWSHVVELLKIDDPLERGFYEKQMVLERWNVRELRRQKETSLFLRLAASKDKEGVLKLAAEENVEGDNPPIGIVLSREKDELLVEYATYEMNSSLFVQKYQLYLPNREELRRELERTLAEAQP